MKFRVLFCLSLLSFGNISGQNIEDITTAKKNLSTASDSARVILLGDIAYYYSFTNIDSSEFYAQKALALASEMDNQYLLANAFSINASIERLKGNFDKAISLYKKSYSIYESIKDSVDMYKILGNIGNAYNYISNDYELALKYYFKSLSIQKKLEHEKETAITYLNISSVYLEQKNYLKALNYLQKVESIAEKNKDFNTLGKAYLSLGEFYSEIEQYEKSELYLNKSLEFRREINDSMGVANTLNNLSAVYEQQQQFEKALQISKQALKIRQELKDSLGLATSYSNTALIYIHLKNFSESIRYATTSLEINSKLNYPQGIAISQTVLGQSYLAAKKYNEAIRECSESYEFWTKNYEPTELNNSCECLYQSYEKLNENKLAYKYFRQSVFLLDSMEKKAKAGEAIRQQTKYEFEKKEYQDSLERAIKEERLNLTRQKKEEAANQKIYLQQWIILFGTLFFILVIVVVVYIFRNNREKQKAVYKQKLTETELMALRAQMNPHFIFNCLSSIQNCVDKNDFQNADKYLGKFSKLLRISLNTSRNAFISIEEEINYLKLYLELESMRMDHKFDFKFDVDTKLDKDEITIPIMITQPFIENSIKHGIASLDKKGIIEISFLKESKEMKIIIRDNGIGREKAQQINKIKGKNHESLGLDITINRIKLLYPEIENPIEINDLKENGAPLGTEIIIHLPINMN